jgi:hypothetical protein
LYLDARDAEKQEGFGLSHSAEVIAEELSDLLQHCSNQGWKLDDIRLDKTIGELGDRGYMQYVKTNIRKLADYLDVKFEVDEAQNKPENVFNLIQNQNVTQVNSQVFESMISNINKLDIEYKTKGEVIKLVNDFKNESTKEQPDTSKLKNIFNKVKSISKEAAAMLSYWATMSGSIEFLFG